MTMAGWRLIVAQRTTKTNFFRHSFWFIRVSHRVSPTACGGGPRCCIDKSTHSQAISRPLPAHHHAQDQDITHKTPTRGLRGHPVSWRNRPSFTANARDVLEDYDKKMRDAEADDHEGKRKVESVWSAKLSLCKSS